MRQTPAKGSTAKHVGTGKHGRTAKHHPVRQKYTAAQNRQFAQWVAKHPQQAKPRALARGEEWDCCCAEALGASLRLAGWPVADEDVLALHVAAGGSQAAGVPILTALGAASAFGLAGVRPASFAPVDLRGLHMFRCGLILGLDLPGPHAVTVATDGCWLSWGGHHSPALWPDAVIEEAWQVTWPAAPAPPAPRTEESYQ